MLKPYSFELLIVLTVAFMWVYPPLYGAVLFGLALAVVVSFKVIEFKQSPDVRKLKDEMKDLKIKVEQLMLKGNR